MIALKDHTWNRVWFQLRYKISNQTQNQVMDRVVDALSDDLADVSLVFYSVLSEIRHRSRNVKRRVQDGFSSTTSIKSDW